MLHWGSPTLRHWLKNKSQTKADKQYRANKMLTMPNKGWTTAWLISAENIQIQQNIIVHKKLNCDLNGSKVNITKKNKADDKWRKKNYPSSSDYSVQCAVWLWKHDQGKIGICKERLDCSRATEITHVVVSSKYFCLQFGPLRLVGSASPLSKIWHACIFSRTATKQKS